MPLKDELAKILRACSFKKATLNFSLESETPINLRYVVKIGPEAKLQQSFNFGPVVHWCKNYTGHTSWPSKLIASSQCCDQLQNL